MNILPFNGVFPQIASSCYISKGVYIIGDVKIGEHSSVWFGTVIGGDVNFIRIGDYVSVQDGSILHVTTEKYPLTIGNRVVIGHRVVLHGCQKKVIPNNSLVMGNPAEVVKSVNNDMLKKVDEGIENYRRLVSLYKKYEIGYGFSCFFTKNWLNFIDRRSYIRYFHSYYRQKKRKGLYRYRCQYRNSLKDCRGL